MILHIAVFCVLSPLSVVSAYSLADVVQIRGPCFEEVDIPKECNATLEESFNSTFKTFVDNRLATNVFLFTPSNPEVAEPLHKCGGRLPPDTTYDPEADTEVFIHGWLDGVCRTAWMREMNEQLRQRGRYNVILVDWSWGNTPDYATAGYNCRIVGEQVGFIINNIMSSQGVSGEKFHLIGHSLGAVASGYVGRSVKGLRRITALDPAYATYGLSPPEDRVTYRDARIVDVIHSNGFECFALGIGDSRPLGHADFYPNGGQFQSSCYTSLLISLLKGDILYGVVSLDPRLCSHVQSLQFYKLSINPKGCEFVGVESSSYSRFKRRRNKSKISDGDWAVMGMNYELYHVNDDENRKQYYLTTSNTCPYYDNSYLGSKRFPFNTTSCTR